MRETHLRGKKIYRERKSLGFSYTYRRAFFRLQLRIRSPLDRVDFWTTGSTHLKLQIVWLDREKDIYRER